MNYRKYLALPSVALFSALAACGGGTPSTDGVSHAGAAIQAPKGGAAGIAWFQGSLDTAFSKGRSESKPVLAVWSAAWCPYCEALKKTVFTRADVQEQFRHFVPIYLDGDLPEAHRLGQKFKVPGYPTVIIFRPDGIEIARVSGGMDLNQYAIVLSQVLEDERPIAEVLAAVIGTDTPDQQATKDGRNATQSSSPEPAARSIHAQDCRRLAYHGWDLVDESHGTSATRAADLTAAAERCKIADPIASTRLSLHALSAALSTASDELNDGQANPAKARTELALSSGNALRVRMPTLVERVRALSPILQDSTEVRAVSDILVGFNSVLYKVVENQGEPFARGFRREWTAAMVDVAHDTNYGESERLLAITTAIEAEETLSADHKASSRLIEDARKQVRSALKSQRPDGERADIVNASRIFYRTIGDDQALYDMLLSEIPKSKTPYYYMPTLASIEEKRGHSEQAIAWPKKGFAATQTPGAQAKWGSSYLNGLIRMTPDDMAPIQLVATQVADALNERDAQGDKAAESGKRLINTLAKWATTPARKEVVSTIEKCFAT